MSTDKLPDIAKGAYDKPKGSASTGQVTIGSGSTGTAGKPNTQTGGKRPHTVMTDKMNGKLCK